MMTSLVARNVLLLAAATVLRHVRIPVKEHRNKTVALTVVVPAKGLVLVVVKEVL